MHTHNVNVKTATEESSRKIGGSAFMTAEIKNPVSGIFASQVHEIINRVQPLREGVTVNVSYISRHGDVQVEIRRHGLLEWYGCVFEAEFLSALEATLLCLQQN